MNEFNNELTKLQAELAHYNKLRMSLESLLIEERTLADEELKLARLYKKEQHDVDALGRISLSSIISSIRGNKEELLDKELMEARAAAIKHDSAVRRLERIRADIKDIQDTLARLAGCEERFNAAVAHRLEEIKISGSAGKESIYRLEERIGHLLVQETEVQEAISACDAAINQILSIESSLDDAKGWGFMDMMGGGLISTMVKHSHLDDAQNQIEHLQHLLSRLRTELADVNINADIQIQIDGFMRFADYFFDGLFSDWMVQGKINDSQEQVASTKSRVYAILQSLQGSFGEIEREIASLKKELSNLVVSL